jgi:hypothetical protein
MIADRQHDRRRKRTLAELVAQGFSDFGFRDLGARLRRNQRLRNRLLPLVAGRQQILRVLQKPHRGANGIERRLQGAVTVPPGASPDDYAHRIQGVLQRNDPVQQALTGQR